jgi:hypothetical protein
MTVVWVVAPCSLVEVYGRFKGACCLHHQGDRPASWVSNDSMFPSHVLGSVWCFYFVLSLFCIIFIFLYLHGYFYSSCCQLSPGSRKIVDLSDLHSFNWLIMVDQWVGTPHLFNCRRKHPFSVRMLYFENTRRYTKSRNSVILTSHMQILTLLLFISTNQPTT